jgi:hypothetical protein
MYRKIVNKNAAACEAYEQEKALHRKMSILKK